MSAYNVALHTCARHLMWWHCLPYHAQPTLSRQGGLRVGGSRLRIPHTRIAPDCQYHDDNSYDLNQIDHACLGEIGTVALSRLSLLGRSCRVSPVLCSRGGTWSSSPITELR